MRGPVAAHRTFRLSPAHRVVAAAIIMATIAGCGLSLTVSLLSIRLDGAGFSARAIGFNTAAGGIAALVLAPFIPDAARRIGVARLLLLALMGGGAVMVSFTLVSGYAAWLVLRFAIGLCVTVLFVLSEYWIGTASSLGARGLAIGLYAASLGIGFAAGPALLAVLGTEGNLPFYVGAGLYWGAIVPLLANRAGAPPLAARSGKPFWIFLREAPGATMAGLLHGAIEVAGIGLLPVYAVRAGAGVEQGVLMSSLFVLGSSVFQIPIGLLSDRVDRRKLLVVIAVLGLVGASALAALGPSPLVLFDGTLMVWAGAVGGLYPVGLAQLGARYRDGDLAGANAALVMSYSLGMLIGPPLIGFGLDLVPPSGFFLTAAALIGVYLLVTAWPLHRAEVTAEKTRVS